MRLNGLMRQSTHLDYYIYTQDSLIHVGRSKNLLYKILQNQFVKILYEVD